MAHGRQRSTDAGPAPPIAGDALSRGVDDQDQLPGTLTDIVDPEGAAQGPATTTASTVTAWLFADKAPPHPVPLEEIAALAADDASFVWVDLDGFDGADLELVPSGWTCPRRRYGSP